MGQGVTKISLEASGVKHGRLPDPSSQRLFALVFSKPLILRYK